MLLIFRWVLIPPTLSCDITFKFVSYVPQYWLQVPMVPHESQVDSIVDGEVVADQDEASSKVHNDSDPWTWCVSVNFLIYSLQFNNTGCDYLQVESVPHLV